MSPCFVLEVFVPGDNNKNTLPVFPFITGKASVVVPAVVPQGSPGGKGPWCCVLGIRKQEWCGLVSVTATVLSTSPVFVQTLHTFLGIRIRNEFVYFGSIPKDMHQSQPKIKQKTRITTLLLALYFISPSKGVQITTYWQNFLCSLGRRVSTEGLGSVSYHCKASHSCILSLVHILAARTYIFKNIT